jgi:uncharacterized repeat protein (TIGR01451 family)
MTSASSTRKVIALLLGVALLLLGIASSAQAAAPAWSLQMSHSLASFNRLDRGAEYTVRVENSGDEATSGTYVLEDTLPPQLTVTSVTAGSGWTCTPTEEVIAGTPLSCTSSETLAAGTSALVVTVRVDVPASAPDTVTNAATISGGGAAAAASATDPTPVIDRPPFGVQAFTTRAADEAGTEYTVAGGHPYEAATSFALPLYRAAGEPNAVEEMKESYVELPPGFLGNPAAATRCPLTKLQGPISLCPPSSRVGVIDLGVRGSVNRLPLYNVIPERGYPAELAFKFGINAVTMYATFRPRTGSYGVTIGVPGATQFGITSIGVTLFGVPSLLNGSGGAAVPFLSNPANCSQAQSITRIAIDSWQHPGRTLPGGSLDLRTPDLSDPNWKTATALAPPATECDAPALASQFHPQIDARPIQAGAAVQADQPSGLAVRLTLPQSNDPTDPATNFDPAVPQAPPLKDVRVTLPAGVAISPAAADGLVGCSDRAEDPAGDQVRYDNTIPVTCPDASKLGTVTATSPLLAAHDPATDAITGPEPIDGDVYLITPHPGDLGRGENQGGTFRVLIQLSSPRHGLVVKLPGTVNADESGRLTATVEAGPQLPIGHLEVNLRSGPRAPLATPVTCGTFTGTTELTPWSTPGTPDATLSTSFDVNAGPNGSACSATPQGRPFGPVLSAGTESPRAGKASPFVLRLTRDDGEQELASITAALPPGLSAKLAGVPYCPPSAIAVAEHAGGKAEQASPSCPAASQVGSLEIGAGAGSSPYYASGKAYLAGPYKGASLSFILVTPTVAGPFDLGNVVVRAALNIDPETARVTVRSDPIPRVLDGVPLRVRDVRLRLDRPGFTLNPTSCDRFSIGTSVDGSSGALASPSTLFQVGKCADLPFKPTLALRLIGPTHRSAHPKLRATLRPRPGDANLSRVTLTLPRTELLENSHIKTICSRPRFAADACPPGSIYGYAQAWSPLLGQPLRGPVFLRSSNRQLPDLVASLNGQIEIDLVGHVDSVGSRIRASFPKLPDLPLGKFVLTMQGGKKGLLANNSELCRAQPRATAVFRGQNGKRRTTHPLMIQRCGKTRPN